VETAQRIERLRPARLMLLGLLACLLWCVLSLFASATSATAHDGSARTGSGLLGVVGETLNGVGHAVQQTTTAVDEVVASVTTAATPAVAPALPPVPEPVAQPVVAVAETVTQTADTAIAAVNHTAGGVVDTVTATVSEIADAGAVSAIVTPVVDVTAEIPAVSGALDRTGVADALIGAAFGLDAAVSGVVGDAPTAAPLLPDLPVSGLIPPTDLLTSPPATSLPGLDGLLPMLPAPASVELADAPATHAAAAAAANGGAGVWPVRSPHATGVPTLEQKALDGQSPLASTSGGTGTSPSSAPGLRASLGATGSITAASGGGASVSALGTEGLFPSAADVSSVRHLADDALPGAPVFDTDVSPD